MDFQKQIDRSRKISFLITYWIMFTLSLQFSIYFASLWPYLSMIDPAASQNFFGWVVAAFCLGQMIASPLFGWWSNHTNTFKSTCVFAMLVAACGNVLFIAAEQFPVNQRFVVLTGRLIMGVGAGVIGVMRAFIATASTDDNRSRAMSIATSAMSFGSMAGPGVQAIVSFIGYPGIRLGPIHIDMYTTPAMFLILTCLISTVLLLTKFDENCYVVSQSIINKGSRFNVVPTFDRFAALVLCWSWFSVMFTLTNMESVGTPYTMIMFNWNSTEAAAKGSFMISGSSVFAFLINCMYIWKAKKVENRFSIVLGLSVQLMFFLLTFSYPTWERPIVHKVELNGTNVTGNHVLGCDAGFSWCDYTSAIPLVLYVASYPAVFAGLPLVNVALATLYSDVLGPRPQAFMQSILMMWGSLAKLIAPIIIMYVFTSKGPVYVWIVNVCILTFSIAMVVFYRKQLVPLNLNPSLKPGDFFKFDNGVIWRF